MSAGFNFIASLSIVLVCLSVSGCGIEELTRDESEIARVILVDVDGREWDITQAVYLHNFDADGFTEGFGAFALVPVLNPPLISPGDSGYPVASDTFDVVGVVLGSTARAYGIDTLRAIEVVNDVHASMLSAIVYDPPSGVTGVYTRSLDGSAVTLAASGWRYGGRSVLFDYETESLWYRLDAGDGLTCINGDLLDSYLAPIASTRTLWNLWSASHPTTRFFPAQ